MTSIQLTQRFIEFSSCSLMIPLIFSFYRGLFCLLWTGLSVGLECFIILNMPQIPLEGVPVDSELDIAVDFRAPESPGRYISYWRMASPSGQKFGQRVWVLIQVNHCVVGIAFLFNHLAEEHWVLFLMVS